MPDRLVWRVGAAAAAAAIGVALAAPQSAAEPANIAGMIVFLDPGQNGANDSSMNRQVPDGRGGTKPCEAPGNSTGDGYPEHAFNWEVALRIRAMLNQLGVRSAMSRGNDNALGP